LSDEYGNKSSVKFIIRGKRSEIPRKKEKGYYSVIMGKIPTI
jgi:hypothetical protein